MTDARLVELVRALPPGGTVWLPAGGRSLWPLVLDGDVLLVRREPADALRFGDLALLDAPGTLIAHVVTGVAPLRTASIVGVADAPGLEALGRVVALRRGTTRLPLPRQLGPLVGALPLAATRLKRVSLLRRLVRRVRDGP